MRNKDLIVALTRTSERAGAMVTIIRSGMPDREMSPLAAIALCRDREDWRGEGPKRHVKRVVFDPPPKADPIWEACWANGGRSVLPVTPGELSYGM